MSSYTTMRSRTSSDEKTFLMNQVAESVDEDLSLNGAVTGTSDEQELSNDEDMVSFDGNILLVDEDIFLNVEDADLMN
jgi:hypothetical protein